MFRFLRRFVLLVIALATGVTLGWILVIAFTVHTVTGHWWF